MNDISTPDLLRALREECGRAEYCIVGYDAILAWFKKMGFVSRSGGLTERTLRNWKRALGLPLGRLPSQGRLLTGKPWTTNLLLATWCVTRARGLVPAWHRDWCPATPRAAEEHQRNPNRIRRTGRRVEYRASLVCPVTAPSPAATPVPPGAAPTRMRRFIPPEHGAPPPTRRTVMGPRGDDHGDSTS